MTQSCSPVRCESTHMVGNLSHKTECVVCVDNAGRMWYARARTHICYGRPQVLMIKL
nr:MAG TPA: Two component regulator propeller [Caudoviricetes sp.]